MLRKSFYGAVDRFVVNIEAELDGCLFWLAATLAKVAARTSEKRDSFLCRVLLTWVPESYGSDILKTYGGELKIVVHGVDVGTKLS